ncbi:MAG: radical SAM protein [Candidatus Schekmanbacteria bacterium]|nr:radical SAM protein [Candidatus Schekmanbacteria bacterium]
MPKGVKESIKNILRFAIDCPHYWLPYKFLSGKAMRPLSVDWELTFRCNLACRICPQELYKAQTGKRQASDEELNIDEMRAVVDDLAQMKVGVITLTGGEPFLHPQALELISYIKEKKIACNILTNGGVITEKIARHVVESKVDAITFSLDGPREVHDDTRGRPGSFDKLQQAVSLIQESKKKLCANRPNLAFNCTISALNQSCFAQILGVGCRLQVPTINFAYLFFTNREAVKNTQKLIELQNAKEEDQILPGYLKSIDVKILQEQLNILQDKSGQQKQNINILPHLKGEELFKYFNQDSYSYCNKCFVPWYTSRINPYGMVYPCSIDNKIGNVRKTPFPQLWNSQAYCNFRRKLKDIGLFPKCNKCCMLNNRLWNLLP